MVRTGILFGILLLASTAHAAINISTLPTQNMSCSAGVCTATAQKAYLNVSDVTNFLATGDLKVVSGAGANDIHIQAPFSWTSTSRLTLDAQRSIEFQKPVSVAGTGALTLVTSDGRGSGDYWFDEGANVSFWDTSSSLIINGQSFTLVKDIKTLASKIETDPKVSVALAAAYDASADGVYGKPPVATIYNGNFEGLGNTISNLQIKVGAVRKIRSFGLFGQLDEGSIRDIVLQNVTVAVRGDSATLGALVGTMLYGSVSHASVGGAIRGGKYALVGGLVGSASGATAVITSSSSSAEVSVGDGGGAGGIIGASTGASPVSLVNSSAEGPVYGGNYSTVGSLGGAGVRIAGSRARASVTAGDNACAGGLVGSTDDTEGSYASGSVVGGDGAFVGGLACLAYGVVRSSDSSASASAGTNSDVGGVIGRATGVIIDAYATGSASGGVGAHVGDLLGSLINDRQQFFGGIYHAYATGPADGGTSADVGGLVGYKDFSAPIEQAYSTGKVTGGAHASIGGFVGYDAATHHHKNNHIISAYWDLDTSGITDPTQGAGNVPNDPGIVGLSDTQLKAALPNGFDPGIWGQKANRNNGYPYLLANPPPKNAPAKVRHH